MAFKREYLKTLGLTSDQIDAVIEAHTEVTDSLKETIKDLTAKAEKADELQKKVTELSDGEDWKKKYAEKEQELKDFKTEVANKETVTTIKAKYRQMLVDQKIGPRQLDAVMRATDFSKMKLDKEGNLEDQDALKAEIKKEWGGFISTEVRKGAEVDNPPSDGNPGGANTRAAELAKRFYEQRYGKPQENK